MLVIAPISNHGVGNCQVKTLYAQICPPNTLATLPITEAVESQVIVAASQVIVAASQVSPMFILVWLVTDDEILGRLVMVILVYDM